MTDDELRDALDGLYAYDGGAGSGIRDESLRARCTEDLAVRRALGPDRWRQWLGALVRDMWLSDVALAQGYGLEEATGFIRWLGERMNCPLR